MKDPDVIFEGDAIIPVEGWVSKADGVFKFVEPSLRWKASVRINNVMEWQWCKTKKEAVAWVKSTLPKTLIKDEKKKTKTKS